MILGIDVSTYFEEENAHAKYFDNGKEIQPLDEFTKQGVNHMRIRLWNNPYNKEGKPYLGGTCDYNNFIKLAHLAKEKGYKIVLDFHYSDFWADPGKQMLPKEWEGMSLEEVETILYEFTKDTLSKAKKEGIDIPFVQIGNEITNGMCWPLGRLIDKEDGTRDNYDNLIRLLKAGIKAAKEVYSDIKIIIHLERSYDQKVYHEYFSQLQKHNVEYDIIGASYYPYWHGTFDQFFSNMKMCKETFNKDIMVMELGYGFTLEDYIQTNNGTSQLVINDDMLASSNFNKPYPLTVEGQACFIKEFLQLARQNGISGVFYWEPLWIPGENICWASKEGQAYIHEEGKSTRNEWANQCMFDYNGNKLPSFDEYK